MNRTKRVKIFPYNKFSESAKALANAMGVKRLKRGGSLFRPRATDTIINWGATRLPDHLLSARILNHPDRVKLASNKLSFFELFRGSEIVPPFTTSREVAEEWIRADKRVCIRRVVDGHEGQGLSVVSTLQEMEDAPLYTLYIPKKHEYRVHVINGEIVDAQRKARSLDWDNPNWEIRNHQNGFVFVRQDVNLPQCVRDASLEIMEGLGLDFGGIDVIYNERNAAAYVLEVNTAPGIEGSTIQTYATHLKRLINNEM